MGKRITLEIPGDPMGKGRPKFSTVCGHPKAVTPKETVFYESKVVFAFKQSGELPFGLNVPLVAKIVAYFKIPKQYYSFHKTTNQMELTPSGKKLLSGEVRPIKKPDCDNIAKICLDSLNGIAYPDDSAIVELSVTKLYAELPKVIVELEEYERN